MQEFFPASCGYARDARQRDRLVLPIRDGHQGVRFDDATPQLERVQRCRVNVGVRFPVSYSVSQTSRISSRPGRRGS
jgi:hypothetical protein